MELKMPAKLNEIEFADPRRSVELVMPPLSDEVIDKIADRVIQKLKESYKEELKCVRK